MWMRLRTLPISGNVQKGASIAQQIVDVLATSGVYFSSQGDAVKRQGIIVLTNFGKVDQFDDH
jgi:hypothetical protein